MGKVKILRIITRLNVGGPAIHTILLTQGLNNERFETLLVSGEVTNNESDMLYLANDNGVKPYFIPELGREVSLKNDFIAFWKLFKLIKKEKPQIVHTHTAKAGALGRLAALIAGTPIRIHTFHGHIFNGYFGRIKTAIFISIERVLVIFTTRIIAVSKQVKDDLLKYGIASNSKIEVVPLGLDLEKLLFINEPDKRGIINIGIIGRLTSIKNHKLFLGVVKEIVNSSTRAINFKVIGDGELREGLQAYCKVLGISDKVEFTGWQTNLEEAYKQLDIVCLTSLNEGTPVAIIEAMAAARPVVATNVGGIKDILLEDSSTPCKNYDKITVSDRGIVVGSFDSVIYAKALNLLIENIDLRIKMGKQGRVFVKERFAKERLVYDMDRLYVRLINGRKDSK